MLLPTIGESKPNRGHDTINKGEQNAVAVLVVVLGLSTVCVCVPLVFVCFAVRARGKFESTVCTESTTVQQ